MRREILADGVRFSGERGYMTVRRPARHVEHMVGDGYADNEFVAPLLAIRDAIVAECGIIAVFDDLEHVVGYDSDVRLKLTAWALRRRSQIVAFHVFQTSRLVAMGVSVANLALGGHIHAHRDRKSFDDALEAEMRRAFSVRPPPG